MYSSIVIGKRNSDRWSMSTSRQQTRLTDIVGVSLGGHIWTQRSLHAMVELALPTRDNTILGGVLQKTARQTSSSVTLTTCLRWRSAHP